MESRRNGPQLSSRHDVDDEIKFLATPLLLGYHSNSMTTEVTTMAELFVSGVKCSHCVATIVVINVRKKIKNVNKRVL